MCACCLFVSFLAVPAHAFITCNDVQVRCCGGGVVQGTMSEREHVAAVLHVWVKECCSHS